MRVLQNQSWVTALFNIAITWGLFGAASGYYAGGLVGGAGGGGTGLAEAKVGLCVISRCYSSYSGTPAPNYRTIGGRAAKVRTSYLVVSGGVNSFGVQDNTFWNQGVSANSIMDEMTATQILSTLGNNFTTDTMGINDGKPILKWQLNT